MKISTFRFENSFLMIVLFQQIYFYKVIEWVISNNFGIENQYYVFTTEFSLCKKTDEKSFKTLPMLDSTRRTINGTIENKSILNSPY